MATNKNRFSITVDDELYKKIEDFQFERRIKSQSKAVNELMLIGLSALMDNDVKIGPDLSDSDLQLISRYNALDKHGKEVVSFLIEKEYTRSVSLAKERLLNFLESTDVDSSASATNDKVEEAYNEIKVDYDKAL